MEELEEFLQPTECLQIQAKKTYNNSEPEQELIDTLAGFMLDRFFTDLEKGIVRE